MSQAVAREVCDMDNVLWLGGGCGSGRSSIARELTHRLDLQLYAVDAHGYDHHLQLAARTWAAMTSAGCCPRRSSWPTGSFADQRND